ncbi:MAG: hypothetical protein HN644_04135 [Rhodospirillales bacterium]|nr:hypothetical protein [Rhodospirillales bacterium]MBT5352606.1 hypothetical protein [Rhodospirillales bacterium]MBT5520228.1 hypothetical protein [Rhodospirillales bacterium]MBT6111117.1 hypothetical protein [Rhodospirillales bacterium]MBT6826676.1 hypothetical protein [Rhodospirillales bacterium]
METLVIQSYRSHNVAPWIETCLASVKSWSNLHNYAYRFVGEEIFDRVPDWYRGKTRAHPQIATDLGRLELIREALDEGYRRVAWLDADVLIFAPTGLTLDHIDSYSFGREFWVQSNQRGELKLFRNTHNALCVFCPGNPFLDFYRHACLNIIERMDVGPDGSMVPQIVGPKLLNALQNMMGLPVMESIGMASPLVITDIAAGGGPALNMMLDAMDDPVCGLNLCASMSPAEVDQACDRLLGTPAIMKPS